MIVKIVCAGNDCFKKLYHQDKNEMLIGCDGGALSIIREHLNLDIAIGDFDSSDYQKISDYSKNIIKVNAHKDESDLELVLKFVSELKEVEKVYIYNATGKRLDHYHAVLNCLINFSYLNIVIIDENNEISLIDSTTIEKDEYKYVSFFAVNDDTIITLKGFLYPLNNKKLSIYDSLCLSNEIKDEIGKVITNKKIMMIKSK